MNLKCRICGATDLPEVKIPKKFAGVAYEDNVEWMYSVDVYVKSDQEPPPLEDKWNRLYNSEIPREGSYRVLRVHYPFVPDIGDVFYALFVPEMSLLNGWDDNPEEIEQSAVVSCRFEKIIDRNDYFAWIYVEIFDVIMLQDLYKTYLPQTDDRALEELGYSDEPYIFEYKNWSYYDCNIQGDLGQWKLIYTDMEGIRHLVLWGDWSFHKSEVYFGNIVSPM